MDGMGAPPRQVSSAPKTRPHRQAPRGPQGDGRGPPSCTWSMSASQRNQAQRLNSLSLPAYSPWSSCGGLRSLDHLHLHRQRLLARTIARRQRHWPRSFRTTGGARRNARRGHPAPGNRRAPDSQRAPESGRSLSADGPRRPRDRGDGTVPRRDGFCS